ncbi:MAG: adaptor protein MecA [Ruminococcus sp.]|nr:adaptor protein MecA [Ruminococcus sp.]
MTITRINENTLMLEILPDEVPVQNEEDLLYYVMDIAVTAENLDTKNSAFLLELTHTGKGLIFMLTVKKKRKRYKIIRQNSTAVYSFERLDHFLSCITAMYRSAKLYYESSTYIMNDKYYICFCNSVVDTSARILLSEFGSEVVCPERFLTHLTEHGNILTEKNSIQLIGESLTCTEP